MKQFGVIIGIDNNNGIKDYRMIVVSLAEKNVKNNYDWKFTAKLVNEQTLKSMINNKTSWLNIKLENGQLKGSCGSLARFEDTKHRPYVILSQIQDSSGKLLGYKVVNCDANVKNITLKEMLAYGKRVTKNGSIPVQNAIFVPEDGDRKEHFKSYPNQPFIIEEVATKKSEYAEQKSVALNKNEKTLSRLEEIYSKEQLIQLKQGKKNGVDIRVYANPELSAEQMKVLRTGLEKRLNIKPFAHPEYKVINMKYYIDCLENDVDIRMFVSPKYDAGQISELSLAVELGLDITKMCNPKLKAYEMAEIRERLESNIWKDEFVTKDGTWK